MPRTMATATSWWTTTAAELMEVAAAAIATTLATSTVAANAQKLLQRLFLPGHAASAKAPACGSRYCCVGEKQWKGRRMDRMWVWYSDKRTQQQKKELTFYIPGSGKDVVVPRQIALPQWASPANRVLTWVSWRAKQGGHRQNIVWQHDKREQQAKRTHCPHPRCCPLLRHQKRYHPYTTFRAKAPRPT